MKREKRLIYFENLYKKIAHKEITEIEEGLIEYIREQVKSDIDVDNKENIEIYKTLLDDNFPIDIEYIIEFFEYLLDKDQKNENGIVFTPKYISDFIVQDSLNDIENWSSNIKIIDPGCGCGIFLISAIEYIHKKYNIDINTIIENNIYGIDIMEENARRCQLAIELYCIINNLDLKKDIKYNIVSEDSLKENWNTIFDVEKFDYIIGNPPYVNPHDMKKETIKFLKDKFKTTQEGVFNIFYAFIENGLKYLKDEGDLEFIIPNNVLTIKSANTLREVLQNEKSIESIIDFSDNMIFKPVRTYNCIIKLNKKCNETFNYCVIDKCDDIENMLSSMKYESMNIELLDKNGWKLVNKNTLDNIRKIEKQKMPIKEFIRTGIATLKDGVYLVDKDEFGFYKNINGIRFEIEDDIVKPIYKVPELKKCQNENEAMQYIIFPYFKDNGTYKLIEEKDLEEKFPKAYIYLEKMKSELDKRDKGKGNPYGWYAYGRTQGLNKYGKKMLFPTFAKNPKFKYIDNENALFCNGYAIFENDKISLNILGKILNSAIMKYYISNTSYAIEGGYYCYQKKYIEKFSIPDFNKEELEILNSDNKMRIDEMLFEKYNIKI